MKKSKLVSIHGDVGHWQDSPGWLTRILKTRDGKYWRASTSIIAWYNIPNLQKLKIDLDNWIITDKDGKPYSIHLEQLSSKEVMQWKLTH